MRLTYFHGDEHLATVLCPDLPFPSTNVAYFCQDCCKTWGRVRRDNSPVWRVVYRSCGCKPHDAMTLFEPSQFSQVPYQEKLTDSMQWARNWQYWPKELLQYELLTLMEHYEKDIYWDSPQREGNSND